MRHWLMDTLGWTLTGMATLVIWLVIILVVLAVMLSWL